MYCLFQGENSVLSNPPPNKRTYKCLRNVKFTFIEKKRWKKHLILFTSKLCKQHWSFTILYFKHSNIILMAIVLIPKYSDQSENTVRCKLEPDHALSVVLFGETLLSRTHLLTATTLFHIIGWFVKNAAVIIWAGSWEFK